MTRPLIVTCVKWGDLYGSDYVNILATMVRRHVQRPTRFECFTDDAGGLDSGIVARELPGDLGGWWNKLYLFKSGAFAPQTRVLFLDLDTVICRSIDAVAASDTDFAILRDFYRPRGLQSAVMTWRAGEMDFVWDQWVADGCPEYSGGDQAHIEIAAHRRWGHDIGAHRILQNVFPGTFASFKADRLDDGPGEAAVVCFHGQPKPHNCGAAWIASHWRTASTGIHSSAA